MIKKTTVKAFELKESSCFMYLHWLCTCVKNEGGGSPVAFVRFNDRSVGSVYYVGPYADVTLIECEPQQV